MPIKKYWNFTDEVSVPADFTEVEGGNGAVSITSNHLRITTGGTTLGDHAAAVFKTAINQSSLTIIMAELKFSGNTGSFVPSIVALMDSSGEPGAMTGTNRNAAMRVWHEDQLSSSGDAWCRVMAKIKNSAGTQYWFDADSNVWTNTFAQNNLTRRFFDDGSYYRFVIIYDGTGATPRARHLVYGWTEGATDQPKGWNINYDGLWTDFNTGTTQIDPVDNSLWAVFGELQNDGTPSNEYVMDFRRIMVGEIDTANVEEFAFTNKGGGAFPIDYEIFKYLNPMPDACTMWIPHERDGYFDDGPQTDTPEISRGTDHWAKDPHVFFDGTTYWMFYQRRDSVSPNLSRIYVASTTDILNGTWGSETLISSPDTGEAKHEFPWVTKYNGTWYLFYGVEFTTGPTWEIQYKTTTATNPTSGWSAANTILDTTGSTAFDDDGCSVPFLVWHSGGFTDGTWYLIYAGNDGTTWKGGLAKSTTGVTGTYTKVQAGAFFDTESFQTQLSGAHTDAAQLTVDSTTGANAGDFMYIDDAFHMIEILSVDDATHMTPSIEVTEADNDNVRSFSFHAVNPQFARRINGYWVVFVTASRFPSTINTLPESVSVYVDTTGNVALEDCTFRQLRVGDAAIDFVIPPFHLGTEESNENPGGVWAELTPVVGAGAIIEESVTLGIELSCTQPVAAQTNENASAARFLGVTIASQVEFAASLTLSQNLSTAWSDQIVAGEAITVSRVLAQDPAQSGSLNDTFSLSKFLATSLLSGLGLEDSVALARELAIALISQSQNESTIGLARQLASIPIDELQTELDLALAYQLSVSLVDTLTVDDAASLSRWLAVSVSPELDVQETASFIRELSLAVLEQKTIDETTVLDRQSAITAIYDYTAEELVILAQEIAASLATQLEGTSAIVLGRRLYVVPSDVPGAEEVLSLGISKSIDVSSTSVQVSSVSLDQQKEITSVAELVVQSLLELAISQDLTNVNELIANSIISLPVDYDIQAAEDTPGTSESISLARYAGFSTQSGAVLEDALALEVSQTVSALANLIAGNDLSISRALELTLARAIAVDDALLLEIVSDISSTESPALQANVGLGRSLDLVLEHSPELAEFLSLTQAAGVSYSTQAQFESSLALNKALVITLLQMLEGEELTRDVIEFTLDVIREMGFDLNVNTELDFEVDL